MGKRQSEELAPATSQAKYPTLIELRQEGGFLFKGVAAAVLATGLAGCGNSAETSPTPDASSVDTRSSDQIMEVSGTADLGSPDRSPDGSWTLIDGVPYVPSDTRPDTADDARPDLTPDLRNPDRIWIVDGGPAYFEVHNDTVAKDAPDARDANADGDGPDGGSLDGSIDSQDDVK